MMEINEAAISYIFQYCTSLMTGDEMDANRKNYFESEIMPNINSSKQLDLYKKFYKYKDYYPASVLNLVKDGWEEFRFNVTFRILKEHGNNPLFNYCPQCGKLARTPEAKQCRFCLHDWH